MDIERYFDIQEGTVPIVFSCPHGGFLKPSFISDKEKGFKIPDKGTFLIAKGLLKALKHNGIKSYYILSKIHRKKIDFNRPAKFEEAFNHQKDSFKIGRKFHSFYHNNLMQMVDKCITDYGKCFLIDFHGFTKPNKGYPDIIIGCLFGNTLNLFSENLNPSQEEFKHYWGYTQLIKTLSSHFDIDNGLAKNNFNIAYAGGYITYQFFKKENVNAIQLEISKKIRRNLNLLNQFVQDFKNSVEASLD